MQQDLDPHHISILKDYPCISMGSINKANYCNSDKYRYIWQRFQTLPKATNWHLHSGCLVQLFAGSPDVRLGSLNSHFLRSAFSVSSPSMFLTQFLITPPSLHLDIRSLTKGLGVNLCFCFHQQHDEGSMMTFKVIVNHIIVHRYWWLSFHLEQTRKNAKQTICIFTFLDR